MSNKIQGLLKEQSKKGALDPNDRIVDGPTPDQLKNNDRLLLERIAEIRGWTGLSPVQYVLGCNIYIGPKT